MVMGDELRGRDAILFSDNLAALSALVSGHSHQEDGAELASAFHIITCALQCRIWGEHVESEANLADEPSREMSESQLHTKIGGELISVKCPVVDIGVGAQLKLLARAFGDPVPAS